MINQVWYLIRWVRTLIHGLLNSKREVVQWLSHIPLSSLHCSHHYPPTLFLIFNSIISTEHHGKLSLSISPHPNDKLTSCTAYTEFTIHPTLTAISLHSYNYELTMWYIFQFQHHFRQIDCHQSAEYHSLKVQSIHHIPMVASELTDIYSLSTQCIFQSTTSCSPSFLYSSNLTYSWSWWTLPNWLDHNLQVHLWVTQSWPTSACPSWLHDDFEVHLKVETIMPS